MDYKLLIDAGNTRVKTALMDAEGHLEPWLNVSYDELLEHDIADSVVGVWLASVSNLERINIVHQWLKRVQLPVEQINSEAQAFGVSNSYSQPTDLGIDRWLAMVGAYNELPKAAVIIDAGTAITVDWVDEHGQHLGGWIAPGVDLMKTSVIARAPKVFGSSAENLWGRAQKLGQSTPDCLLDGCVNAFVGLVRQAIAVSETELDWFDYRILFSGGSLPLLPADLKRRGEVRTELVLQGLACYART